MTTEVTTPRSETLSKNEVLELSRHWWNPDKTDFWQDIGVPLVIGKRAGYVLTDMDGHEVIDVHLNGGTYNLGHRNPEIIAALVSALERVDVGNHHFPAPGRALLAERLAATAPGTSKVVFGSSGGEIVDLAIKSVRQATGRRRIVSIVKAFHGHTGLALSTGDERFTRLFHSDFPQDFTHVPFNDVDAVRAELAEGDVAAVIMETIPATYGFPMPAPGYLRAVKDACEEHGSLYIADEVQVGLMRTGTMWAIHQHDVVPDVIVTGKGLSGGIYPVTAALLGEAASQWLSVDGFAHMATFGGSELGCEVALAALDIYQRPETADNVRDRTVQYREGLAAIAAAYPSVVQGIRQHGLVIGIETTSPHGAKPLMVELYNRGVWAIFSTLDARVLQFKPGVLVTQEETDRILEIVEAAVAALVVPAAGTAGTAGTEAVS